ncbi:MAG TPA: hypothetical protein VIX63_11895 [Vicinamibacterales bacterium]
MTVVSDTPPQPVVNRKAQACAWAYALLVAFALGHFLLGLPIQFSESFGNMQKLSTPWRDLIAGEFGQNAYLRPMLWAAQKLVYDLSNGNYFPWFRGFHVIQVVVLILLYLGLVRPRTWRDAAVLPLGLAVLLGLHTFAGTVREAFPINTFMTVLICCYSAAVIALGTYRWWHDIAAVLLLVAAALTLESGLLVGVIVIGAALVGGRGVSRAGLAAVAALLAGYFYLRFVVLDVGLPGLIERSSGYGFRILEPPELIERFGSNPTWFYAYNVVTSAVSVLLTEPSGGAFNLTSAFLRDGLDASMLVTVIASGAVTALVGAFAWRRRAAWRSRRFDRDDQLVLLFLTVLFANALISYAYTKDVIMSPAGAFLAVAAFIACRSVLASLPAHVSGRTAAISVVAAFLVSMAWANRVLETHALLRSAAFVERNAWAYVPSHLQEQGVAVTPQAARLLRTLHDDALFRYPPPPAIVLPSVRLLVEE